jgi:hypothetical protein
MQTSTVFPTDAELDALACRLTNNSTVSRPLPRPPRARLLTLPVMVGLVLGVHDLACW